MVSVLRSEVDQAREALPQSGGRPWDRTGACDVEALAVWAYGPQMVDRFERAGLHAIEASASGFEPSALSACGVGQLMQISHLGARIDRGGVSVSDVVHPAAYALAAALPCVENGRRVRHHALSGTRPAEWQPPMHKSRPRVWVKEGEKAQVEYLGPGRSGAHCPIIIAWDAQRQAWGREQYRLWWQALADLAWLLSSRALGFIVTGPAAPAEPWNEKSAEPNPISIDGEAKIGGAPRGSSQAPSG